MDIKQIESTDLSKLVESEIIELRGISGVLTTVEIAKQAPTLVQAHALSGLVLDLVAYIPELDTFNVESS
jgi:hypothetical protein